VSSSHMQALQAACRQLEQEADINGSPPPPPGHAQASRRVLVAVSEAVDGAALQLVIRSGCLQGAHGVAVGCEPAGCLLGWVPASTTSP
jgi:hypothetical protein